MVNPSKRLLFYGFHKLHSHGIPSNPRTSVFSPLSSPHLPTKPPSTANHTRAFSSEVSSSGSSIPGRSRSGFAPDPSSPVEIWRRLCFHGVLSKSMPASSNTCSSFGFANLRRLSSGIPSKSPPFSSGSHGFGGIGGRGLGIRLFSSKNASTGKFDVNAVKSLASKPLSAAASVASQYRHAAGLQMEAFWKRNYLVLVGAGALTLCIFLWRIMFGVASTFVGLSEGMAKYGFLALASAMVAFAGLYIRSRLTINPDKIYRIAMRKLNTSAGILEIMGAPLAGTDVRAYVMSGSGPRLKNFKLRLGGKRCFLIFPIRGSERKGLVSVEAKKKKGQYNIKLLAVDVPMATGPDQCIFLIGDEKEYKVGGGLISELRDPIVKAMAAEKEFEELDQKEEEEDEERELQEEERKRREEVERLEKTNS